MYVLERSDIMFYITNIKNPISSLHMSPFPIAALDPMD